MANSNEIAQIELINKGLTSLDGSINKIVDGYMKVIKSISDGNAVIKDATTSQNNLTNAQNATAAATEKLDALDKQLAGQEAKLKQLEDDRMKTIIANKIAIQEKTKAVNDAVKAEGAEEGSLVRMRQKLSELTAEYLKAGVRTKEATKEVNDLSRAIGKAEAEINIHGRGVGGYRDQLGGMIPTIGSLKTELIGMLPVLGIAAAGAAIVGVFKSIRDSSHAMSDLVEFNMAGLSGAVERFWTVLATGDFENFWKGLGKSFDMAKLLATALDEVADNGRALRKQEIDWAQERVNLEIKYRTELKTNKIEAEKTGKLIVDGEQAMANKRAAVAKKEFDAYEKIAMDKTGLDAKRLLEIAGTIDSEEKARATAYIDAQKKIDEETGTTDSAMLQRRAKLKALKDSTNADDVKNAEDLIKFDKYQKESLQENYINAYVKLGEAEKSAKDTTKKIETSLNVLKIKNEEDVTAASLKGVEDRQKANEKSVADAKIAADKKIKAEECLAYSKTGLAKMTGKETKVIEEDGLKSNQKFLDEKTKQAEKQAAKEKQIQQDLKKAKIDLAIQAGNAIFEFQGMALTKELNQLQVEKDNKLANSKLTTEQRAKIEAEYTKKQNEIKAKQAKNDKLQALFNIAINTAVSVGKTARELGFPAAIPFIAIAIASGLIQAALVAAQPIPKYAKGTQSAERAGIFGEAGRELMFPKGGGAILAEKETYFEGDRFKGAVIKNSYDTERMMSMVADRNIIVRNQTDDRLLNEMREVKRAILNKPVAIYDQNHRAIGIGNSTHQEIYLNRLTR